MLGALPALDDPRVLVGATTGDDAAVFRISADRALDLVSATAATCEYSVPYTAVLEQDNVFGVQFHPEKSGDLGLKIVRNFVES